jgi:DNA helicase II / ATP-dependent DNA helicase PcrA
MPLANPTEEQIEILLSAECTQSNLMISAFAGCGKTSTLEATAQAVKQKAILYLTFNKRNAVEAEARMPPSTTVRTFNSMGHRIWADSQGKRLTVESNKCRNIYKDIIDKSPKDTRDALWHIYSDVLSGCALAKALGYLPDGFSKGTTILTQSAFHLMLDEVPDDLTSDLIDTVLRRSIKQSFEGLIDYNDQVYMPALFGGVFPKYPLVLVDEYQDLSPVNHALLAKLAKARIIGVGDPNQNIYGFRGAKAGGMAAATTTYSATELPLSISFRCPSAIVQHVQWHVPSFRWFNEGGQVDIVNELSAHDIPDDCTIICRNNAPLLRVGFRLLGLGRSISVAGTDIGPRLISIMKKLGDTTDSRADLLTSIADWEEAKLERESKSAPDMAACMRIFAQQGRTLGDAITYAEHLFRQQGSIYLTTGHKAKGLEWSKVIHLDPWLVRRDPTEQNRNLDYVISTRSRDSLTEIESEAIQW